jgi:glycosyltransferase involved in cell wall biosynthesis
MKIALVFPGCHKRGGVERSVWEAAHRWRSDHQITVVSSIVDAQGLDGVEIRQVPSDDLSPWRFGRAARGLYHMTEFDHVVSFGVLPVPATVLWVNSVHRAWLEASRRFPGPSRLRNPMLRYVMPRHVERLLLERRYFRAPDRSLVVTVADAVGRDLTRLYGVDPSLLTTVHNGFDPAEFDPGRRDRDGAAARDAWHIPRDAVVLCMVANELPRKGYDVVLRAVAEQGDPRLHVVLAGSADPSGYDRLVESLRLNGRVHYVGQQSDVGRLHAASDAFVLPTKYEAFCLAIIEALASGLPVITTSVPGAGDVITHGANGLIQHYPEDHVELARLLDIVADDDSRRKLAAATRPSVDHLSWATLLDAAITRFPAPVDPSNRQNEG